MSEGIKCKFIPEEEVTFLTAKDKFDNQFCAACGYFYTCKKLKEQADESKDKT